jgi:hypothetical protein
MSVETLESLQYSKRLIHENCSYILFTLKIATGMFAEMLENLQQTMRLIPEIHQNPAVNTKG